MHIFHFGSIGLYRQFFQLVGRVGIIIDSVFRTYPKSVFSTGCKTVDGVVGQCAVTGDETIMFFGCIVDKIIRYTQYATAFGSYP